MPIRATSRRPLLLTWLAALVLPLALLAPASAMPGDPPIVAVSPAEGAAVPADADGIPVVYTCPVYRTFEDPVPFGSRSDYGVRFATSAALDPDGRLAGANLVGLAGPDQVQDADLPADHCRGYLTGEAASTPGTYYWQATRICTGCSGGYETGPVRSFTLTLAGAGIKLKVKAPAKPYAGFPTVVTVKAKGLGTGALVSVEGKVGSRWKSLGKGTVVGKAASVVVKPTTKVSALRAVFTSGESVTSKPVPVAPRVARSWPQAGSWSGDWKGDVSVSGQEQQTASFTVRGGRPPTLRDGRFRTVLLCPTPGQTSPFTIQVVDVTTPKVKLDPDGRFVHAEARKNQSVLMFGRLQGRRGSGDLRVTLGVCAGSARLSLQHR